MQPSSGHACCLAAQELIPTVLPCKSRLPSTPYVFSPLSAFCSAQLQELIPTALRYDPHDSVATTFVVLGMVVMAASLLLFTI